MRLWLSVLVFMLFATVQNVSALNIEGVELQEELSADGTSLYLVGGGVRSKFFMDLYVGSLYTEKGEESVGLVMHGAGKAIIRLDIISGMITSEGFDNATEGQTEPIKSEIEAFIGVFKDEIKVGDSFVFVADGGQVRVVKNDAETLTIDNPSLRSALFGI